MNTDYFKHKIEDFWEWFQSNEIYFRKDDVATDLIEELDNHILGFGLFSWQIGEGNSKPRFLTVSPNGNPRRMELSKRIMDSAPLLDYWEFNYCKPAKNWNFIFEMYDSFMVMQEIDASDWAYALFEKSSGNVEIRLQVNHPSIIDLMDKKAAADLVITNILGEEKMILHVEDLMIVSAFIPEHQHLVASITMLRGQFEELVL